MKQHIDTVEASTDQPTNPESLHICLTSYRGNPTCGGQGVYLKNLSSALAKLNHKVTVVSGQPYPNLEKHNNIELVKLPTLNMTDEPRKILSFKAKWLTSRLDLWEYFSSLSGKFPDPESFGIRLLRWIKTTDKKIDIIHDNQTLSYASLTLKELMPLTTIIHHPITRDLVLAEQSTDSFWLRMFIRRWYSFLHMQKLVAPKLQSVVSPSLNSKRDISEDLAVPLEAITTLPLGVDQSIFKPLAHKTRNPKRIISTVSADAPLKGMIYLLKAMQKLIQIDKDIRLTVIGKPKINGASDKFINMHNLADYITFTGYITEQEIVEHYSTATVAVVPSLYEGFCIPAIESMSCGVPLVTTDAGSIPEIIGDAGVICQAGNEHALADSIMQLLNDQAKRTELIKAGHQLVNEKYDWQVVAKKMTLLYQREISAFKAYKKQSNQLSYANY